MDFPPIFRRLQPSSYQRSEDREGKDETTRPTNPRKSSHKSLCSDWTTCPASISPTSPRLILTPPSNTPSPPRRNLSPLTSWITAPPGPPTSKQKLEKYINYLSIPCLDQNITYLLSHPEAIPEGLKTPCFQTAMKFLAHYVLPAGLGEKGVWDFEIERGELEDLMIVGARLGHEYALPSSIRKRNSFLALALETQEEEADLCEETNGDDEDIDNKSYVEEEDEEAEWLSDSYRHLLGEKDPFDLPICWGRPFGRELFPRDNGRGGIEDEEYDALEGAYPDFRMDGEMGIFGGAGGGLGNGSEVEKERLDVGEKGRAEGKMMVGGWKRRGSNHRAPSMENDVDKNFGV